MIFPVACLISLATAQVSAQFVTTMTTTQTLTVFPSGVAQGNSSVQSQPPLACDVGCFPTAGTYLFCFTNQTLQGPEPLNQTACDNFFCNQTNFYGFFQCLNCIIANGGERPFGYPVSSTFNAATASPPSERHRQVQQSHKALTGDLTITATATTTGPYETTWTSGQTKNIPQWTGLTQYSIPIATNTFTYTETLRSSPSATAAGSASMASSGSAGAASASTSKSGAERTAGFGVGVFGGMIGYALYLAQY